MTYTYYKHCGCELGEDCTKVTQCALNEAVEQAREELSVSLEQYEKVRRERDRLGRLIREVGEKCGNLIHG